MMTRLRGPPNLRSSCSLARSGPAAVAISMSLIFALAGKITKTFGAPRADRTCNSIRPGTGSAALAAICVSSGAGNFRAGAGA